MINLKLLTSILEQYKLSDEQAEELQKVIYKLDDGRLVELPCKVGDRCYHVTKYRNIIDCTVSAIHYGRPLKQKGAEYIVLRSNVTGYVSDKLSFKDFQENVYFTREEAEKALKEVKENE